MSIVYDQYLKATSWFQETFQHADKIKLAEQELEDKCQEWVKYSKQKRIEIEKMKRHHQQHYLNKDHIKKYKKKIADWRTHSSNENYICKKLEYAVKCLDFLKSVQQEYEFAKCDFGDSLSNDINILGEYLATFDTDDQKTDMAFPSVFELKIKGYSLDHIIGLAHIQAINEFDLDKLSYDIKYSKTEFDEDIMVVDFIPEIFRDDPNKFYPYGTKEFDGWGETKYSMSFAQNSFKIGSPRDLSRDCRNYDNRFGFIYSTTFKDIIWEEYCE